MADEPRVIGVIPARLASSRLPRKVLREIAGTSLLGWVYAAAMRCPQFSEVLIAADSDEVVELCAANRWPCLLTSPELASGTDRLHAVSRGIDADIYVNIQGDEPLLHEDHVKALLSPFAHSHVDVTTLKVACRPEDVANPNAVKVVTALDGRALYFSRSAIPYNRDHSSGCHYWKHLGFYAYRKAALQRFASLPPGTLEQSERLEQLRLLENGMALYVSETDRDTVGIDTEEDFQRVQQLLMAK
jgi:3-deoxy-manno-octulosonate cytidylyltransferase (CMP-KDO synthetase)